jgi:hypothetical protein
MAQQHQQQLAEQLQQQSALGMPQTTGTPISMQQQLKMLPSALSVLQVRISSNGNLRPLATPILTAPLASPQSSPTPTAANGQTSPTPIPLLDGSDDSRTSFTPVPLTSLQSSPTMVRRLLRIIRSHPSDCSSVVPNATRLPRRCASSTPGCLSLLRAALQLSPMPRVFQDDSRASSTPARLPLSSTPACLPLSSTPACLPLLPI